MHSSPSRVTSLICLVKNLPNTFQDIALTMFRDERTARAIQKHYASGHTTLGGGIITRTTLSDRAFPVAAARSRLERSSFFVKGRFPLTSFRRRLKIQESCTIAKMTAQCALYMGALKIFGTPWLRPRLLFPTFFTGFCSDRPSECSYKIWSP